MTKRVVAFVFPGQGCQRVGMIKDLLEQWPRLVGDVLEEASDAIQFNLEKLMTIGSQEKLTQTQYAQPAILAHSTAVLRIFEQEIEWDISKATKFVLGHSLGEYSALVAARTLPFADAIKLVHFRGQAMQRAVASGVGTMAALMPVSPRDAEEICADAAVRTKLVCEVANYNTSKQTVISGASSAVEEAIKIAKTEKKVRRALHLDVSAPFHCSLMAPAAAELSHRLNQIDSLIASPLVPVVWNVEAVASKKNAAEIQTVLSKQVVSPVRWSQSVDFCIEQGVKEFVEIGYGGILTGLIKQHSPKTFAISCGTGDQLRDFLTRA